MSIEKLIGRFDEGVEHLTLSESRDVADALRKIRYDHEEELRKERRRVKIPPDLVERLMNLRYLKDATQLELDILEAIENNS